MTILLSAIIALAVAIVPAQASSSCPFGSDLGACISDAPGAVEVLPITPRYTSIVSSSAQWSQVYGAAVPPVCFPATCWVAGFKYDTMQAMELSWVFVLDNGNIEYGLRRAPAGSLVSMGIAFAFPAGSAPMGAYAIFYE